MYIQNNKQDKLKASNRTLGQEGKLFLTKRNISTKILGQRNETSNDFSRIMHRCEASSNISLGVQLGWLIKPLKVCCKITGWVMVEFLVTSLRLPLWLQTNTTCVLDGRAINRQACNVIVRKKTKIEKTEN